MKKAKVTITMALYGSLPYTKQCLKYLIQNTPENLYNLIMMDNASNDGTFEWLTNERNIEFPDERVKLIKSPKNIGFGMAHDKMAELAETDIIVMLNNDTIPTKGWLEPIIEEFENNEKCEVVGSKLISPFNNKIQHAGVIFNGIYPQHRLLGAEPDDKRVSKREKFPAVTGACFGIRKDTFLPDGFDSNYWCGWEDIDYCLRMQKQKKEVVYRPDSVLYHYEGQSEGRLIAESKNRVYFMSKWLPDINKWTKDAYKKLYEERSKNGKEKNRT